MSRTKKGSSSESAPLDKSFWAIYGLTGQSETKDKLVALAMSEISRRGILDVNARSLCDLLDVDYSLVTYHFGSFDGLLAEVFVKAHDIWIGCMQKALIQEYSSPEERFRAVIKAQVQRAETYGSVIGLAHLPHVSENVEHILDEKFPERLANAIAYAVAVSAILINDLRSGQLSPFNLEISELEVALLEGELKDVMPTAARLQWALVGPTLWMTGSGGGHRDISEKDEQIQIAALVDAYIDKLVISLKIED
jgi:AcrR family transcriptional regulator